MHVFLFNRVKKGRKNKDKKEHAGGQIDAGVSISALWEEVRYFLGI